MHEHANETFQDDSEPFQHYENIISPFNQSHSYVKRDQTWNGTKNSEADLWNYILITSAE